MPEYCTPQIGEASITISLSRWAASSMLCLFVCFFRSIPFFSQTLSREKERDEHKWHKVHKTVKAEKRKLNRSLCSLLTSSKMLLSLSYVVFTELHKTLTFLKLHLNLQKMRHHLNEMKRINCLSIPFRLTGSKPLKNGSELKKSWAFVIIYNILLIWQNFSLPEFGPGLEWIYPASTRHVSRIMQLKPRLWEVLSLIMRRLLNGERKV